MASWQARSVSFLLRHLFKPRLARAHDVGATRKVMGGGSVRPPPRGVRAVAGTVGGVAGEWMLADSAPTMATLLYLHGGGFIACTPQTHRAITSSFAHAGLRTFAPDYRLAPEHPFPAGLEDALSAYRALRQENDPRRLVVAGDSRRLADRARAAGVDVELKVWPVVPHVWQLFHRVVPEGKTSLAEASAFLARRTA